MLEIAPLRVLQYPKEEQNNYPYQASVGDSIRIWLNTPTKDGKSEILGTIKSLGETTIRVRSLPDSKLRTIPIGAIHNFEVVNFCNPMHLKHVTHGC